MAKNWIKIDTIYSLKDTPKTISEKRKETKVYNKLMSTTKTLSIKDLRKQSSDNFNKKKEEENSLLKAFEDKKLKSEKAIKQAIRIKKERAKRQQDSAKQDTEKVSVNSETTDNPV